MSSTNKTANLGLNQWTRSDPVNMDDFNADNQKLDTAVNAAQTKANSASTAASAAHSAANAAQTSANAAQTAANAAQTAAANAANANPWVRLMDVTIASTINVVELNLSAFNLEDYITLNVSVLRNAWDYSNQVLMRVNKLSGSDNYNWLYDNTSWQPTSAFTFMGSTIRMDISPDSLYVVDIYRSYRLTSGLITPTTWKTIEISRDFSGNKNIPAGTRFIIWGAKK